MADKAKEKKDNSGRTLANKERKALKVCHQLELKMLKFERKVQQKLMDPFAFKLACDRMNAHIKLTMSRLR